ncbi:uncharacterized protein KD926_003354 [Aspergillus affinis]|uniref:uncharacterized protein n=1 Tax=Aspergillus affinis TaxID=1070780 RepID=UPI0022FDDDEE|nr:uncharacterized protein KD926_003354 [Aspergillus affinis]KAI9043584.1 hypothetical protein KD926_003354 [Aspergillus affinis]
MEAQLKASQEDIELEHGVRKNLTSIRQQCVAMEKLLDNYKFREEISELKAQKQQVELENLKRKNAELSISLAKSEAKISVARDALVELAKLGSLGIGALDEHDLTDSQQVGTYSAISSCLKE